MGNCFFCFGLFNSKKSTIRRDRYISDTYPGEDVSPMLKDIHANDKYFYYLPGLGEIDKALHDIDSAGTIDEDIRLLLIDKLDQMSWDIENWTYYDPYILRDDVLSHNDMNFTNCQKTETAILDKPLLLIEIQQGVLEHPSFKKSPISELICLVELINPLDNSVIIKRWENSKKNQEINTCVILWKKLYGYLFQEEPKRLIISISLYYKTFSSKVPRQISEVQSFELCYFPNQEVYEKEIYFKDKFSKGRLATLFARFQYIHDIKALQERKKLELHNRGEKMAMLINKAGLGQSFKKDILLRASKSDRQSNFQGSFYFDFGFFIDNHKP